MFRFLILQVYDGNMMTERVGMFSTIVQIINNVPYWQYEKDKNNMIQEENLFLKKKKKNSMENSEKCTYVCMKEAHCDCRNYIYCHISLYYMMLEACHNLNKHKIQVSHIWETLSPVFHRKFQLMNITVVRYRTSWIAHLCKLLCH